LSIVGIWIGAALATPMQANPPVAASPIAVESFRKSRRARSVVIFVSSCPGILSPDLREH
jgi:hypothetical protein